jgi:hypothetical protein
VVTLLREDGSGSPYVLPGHKGGNGKAEGRYLHVPHTFWTNGWHYVLSGSAIAVFLAIADRRRPDEDYSWVSPRLRTSVYGMSEDTWRRGKKELSTHGLIAVRRTKGAQRDVFDIPRTRDEYRLKLDRLNARPDANL